jgi:hypothetical protein
MLVTESCIKYIFFLIKLLLSKNKDKNEKKNQEYAKGLS